MPEWLTGAIGAILLLVGGFFGWSFKDRAHKKKVQDDERRLSNAEARLAEDDLNRNREERIAAEEIRLADDPRSGFDRLRDLHDSDPQNNPGESTSDS